MPNRFVPNVWFSNLLHRDCCLYTHFNPMRFQRICQCQRIHHCRQHSHMICTCAILHLAAASPSEEVAATYNNPNLRSKIHTFFNTFADRRNHIVINPKLLLTGKSLSAQLEQDPFILDWHKLPP